MDFKKDIDDLLKVMEEHNLTKVSVKKKDFEVILEKEGSGVVPIHQMMPPPKPQPKEVAPAEEPVQEEHAIFITSPIVGTFYSSPSPDDPAFIKVGDQVDSDRVVCIIEAMKVMNEVKSTHSGKVAEMLIKDGDPVEFGTKLFKLV